MSDPPSAHPTNDDAARPFFELDSLIDRGVAAGKTAQEIYAALESRFLRDFPRVIKASIKRWGTTIEADAYYSNFVHLMCPAKTWGSPNATVLSTTTP